MLFEHIKIQRRLTPKKLIIYQKWTLGYYNEAAQITQQAKQLGVKAKILGSDGFDSPQLVTLGGSSTEGVIFSTPFYREEPRG